MLHHKVASLVARVVENDSDWQACRYGQPVQQGGHGFRIDIGFIADGDCLLGCRVNSAKHVQPLAAMRRPDEWPRKSPEKTEEGGQDKMGRVYKEDLSLPPFRLVKPWLKLFFNSSCSSADALPGMPPAFRQDSPILFMKCQIWGMLTVMSVC